MTRLNHPENPSSSKPILTQEEIEKVRNLSLEFFKDLNEDFWNLEEQIENNVWKIQDLWNMENSSAIILDWKIELVEDEVLLVMIWFALQLIYQKIKPSIQNITEMVDELKLNIRWDKDVNSSLEEFLMNIWSYSTRIYLTILAIEKKKQQWINSKQLQAQKSNL